MPAPAPVAYATLSQPLPAKPYILGIHPAATSPHLLLRHPSSDITIADNQSLQAIDALRGGHTGHVTAICAEQDAIWSSGKEGAIIRWDERSRRPGIKISAFVRKPLPVLALAVSADDHLVIGGTELVSAEAHILFWDIRNPKNPIYTHSSTHSDDITHLSLLPPTSTFLTSSSSNPLPSRLLLSTSTDGLAALSDMRESNEDDAVLAAENWGQSIADAGAFATPAGVRIWARSDMDHVALWTAGKGAEDELELQDLEEYGMESFKSRTFSPPMSGPSTVRSAVEERGDKDGKITSDYLIDVTPSLGLSKKGTPLTAVGSNDGDIVLLHRSTTTFEPSAYFLSGPGPSRGHKDVVRALYHDVANEAVYTGSEDGVLSGWSLASLASRLRIGNQEVDDDGGDGREDAPSEDESEESEIETEDSEMDVDGESEDEREEGPRNGPILGGVRGAQTRKEKRREKRVNPY